MTTAIVLAAGSSIRMGQKNKLTLPYSSSTILATVIDQLLASDIDEIIVVLGYEKEKIRNSLDQKRLIFCYNSNHLSGMTSSIQTGIQSASENTDGYLICLSDMPFLDKNDYNTILQKITNKKEILLPFYQNKKGNPVYFSQHFKLDILAHQPTEGCKEIVQKNKFFVNKVLFKNDHILRDIDTQADYIFVNN